MNRTGITSGLAVLLGVVLGLGPVAPGHAVDDSRTTATSHTAKRAAPPKPTVSRLTPASGPTAGGVDVTIKGKGLVGVKKVLFGTSKAKVVSSKSAKKLVVTAPAHAAGAVQVKVVTKAGSSATTKATTFTYVAPPPQPVLSTVAPARGPTTGGTTVTLTGSGLGGASAVRFAGNAASYTVVSPTRITASSPPHAAGAVSISVTTPGGAAQLDDAFTYLAAPTVFDLSPGSGPTQGGTVTILGTGFTADTAVTFGGVAATDVVVRSAGEITVTAPAHAAGSVTVTVTTVGGTASVFNGYVYVGAVALTGVSPAAGPAAGGTTVTLTGSGFTDAFVTFGSKPALEVDVNEEGTQLTAVTPARAPGAVTVTVGAGGGSAELPDAFTYVAAPTLTAVSPTAGPTAGGTSVTLSGTGFTTTSAVRFGGVAATGVTVNGAGTSITASVPAHAAGAVDVSVSTVGGTATLAAAYTYVAAPTLTGVNPSSGPADGGTQVTLSGSGFGPSTTVTFGGTAASVVSVAAGGTSLVATAPPHAAGTVGVTVTNPSGGTASLSAAFTYVVAPTVTSVSPALGAVAGGDRVTLTGTGFTAGAQVSFGGTAAAVVSVGGGGTTLTVITPEHAVGPVDVAVTTVGGPVTATGAYTYVAAPTVTGVDPGSGPGSGGTDVTITGTGFRAGATVRFGGDEATSVVLVSSTELLATTPPHAPGTVGVSVSTVGGTGALGAAFTFVGAPSLSGISPSSGPAAGGQTVTLTGSGFTDASVVEIGGAAATDVDANAAGTSLTATTPAHAAGTVGVSVTGAGGAAVLTAAYTFVAAPAVSALAPQSGPIPGGTQVTLTGTGLTDQTEVDFGGVPATDVNANAAGTSLTATTPPHAAGVVDVVVTAVGGTTTLPSAFTYVAAPALASVTPDTGPAAGGQSVTVTGTAFTGTTAVSLGGAAATFAVDSDTQITVTTPPHAAGVVGVSVTTAGGTSTLPNGYTYVAAPTLTQLSPTSGPVGGGQVATLTGTDLRDGMQVRFDTDLATLQSVNPAGTAASVTVPPHIAGAADVSVTTVGGTATLDDAYVYFDVPTVTGLSPGTGPVAGGTSVTVTGSGLTGTTGVSFGGVPTSFTVDSDTQITATSPTGGGAGPVDVVVTAPSGSVTVVNGFTYVAGPSVSSVTPNAGSTGGGEPVVLSGSGFTGTTSVSFGGAAAASFTVDSDTQITATSPTGDGAGPVDVVVTTPDGLVTVPSGYTYVDGPSVSSVSPSSGPEAGGQSVVLTGTALSTTTEITFGGVPASFTVDSDGQLTATSPAGAGAADIVVTTAGGSTTIVEGYLYQP